MAKKARKTEKPVILMTKADRAWLADFRKVSKAHVDRVTKTKEAALKDLVDAGICDPDGQLNKRYRSVA